MSHEAFWSLEYCLSCDKQTLEGPYCSQACRLADLSKGQYAVADSETTTPRSSSLSTSSVGFALPPAFDFQGASRSRSRSSSASATTSSPVSDNLPSSLRPLHTTRSFDSAPSSRNSVSSESGTPLSAASSSSSSSSSPRYYMKLSSEARQELQRYEECFDVSRYHKVRTVS